MSRPRLVVGLSGATGAVLCVRLLEELRKRKSHEIHLIASPSGLRTLKLELPERPWSEVRELADEVHDHRDVAAAPASGSYPHEGMAIVPMSMASVAALAHGFGDNLLTRAADVCLKERRRLVLVPREAPLHQVHLRNLAILAELGAVILPPMLAFYQQPRSVEDQVDQVVGKVLEHLGFTQDLTPPWEGPEGLSEG